MYMIGMDESLTHPALINGNYIRADEYDPTKNTPVVIDMRLGGKRMNKRISKKRTNKKKRINKKKETNKKNKRKINSY